MSEEQGAGEEAGTGPSWAAWQEFAAKRGESVRDRVSSTLFDAGWEAALDWAGDAGSAGFFCCVCWITSKGDDTVPAVMVINGLSACWDHAPYVQGGELAAVMRLIQERNAARWIGIRVTLSCGHIDLRAAPKDKDQARRWAIGGHSACWTCPARERRGGGRVAAVRMIVNVEPVTAPREPESLDPVHWYWEGEGD